MTVVSPGYISTGFSLNALTADGSKHGITDPHTARGLTPHRVARAVLEGVAEGRREVVVAKPLHHLAVYGRVWCPGLLDWVLRHRKD